MRGPASSFLILLSVPSHQIEIVGFSDEEGVRFHTTFIGSKVITGKFDRKLLTDAMDKQGVSLREVRLSASSPSRRSRCRPRLFYSQKTCMLLQGEARASSRGSLLRCLSSGHLWL